MSFKHKREAYAQLFRHYRQVFGHYWKLRNQLGGNLFKENEAEFLPAALSLQEKPVSPSLRITAMILISLVAILFFWSVLGRIDIIVNATGDIIPTERTKSIAAVEIASVKALYVEEGQAVKKGDLLIELDASSADAEHGKAMSGLMEATLQIARSHAIIEAVDSRKPPKLSPIDGISDKKLKEAQGQLDSQYHDFMAKLQRLDGMINRYSLELPMAEKRALDFKELAHNHDVSNHAYLEKEQASVDLEGQLTDAKNQREALIADTRRVAYEAQAEGNKIVGSARQDATRTEAHSKLLKLTSPVDGTVQQLTTYTVGGVVPAAQPLMRIVPKDNHIVVEAMLENKDIGFVEEGQIAAVKVDAFEYTKYGTIPARVVHVSRDAIKDEKRGLLYSVIIDLDKSFIIVNGHEMGLSAGMTVKVDIKTGTRRVIEYVLSPLIQHAQESIHER